MTGNPKAESVYLGDSIVEDINDRAGRNVRTWSGQLGWLCVLGLAASHLIAPDPKLTKDDSGGRRYFYPDEKLVARLRELQARLTKTTGHKWSFSAVVRAAALIGIRLDDIIERFGVEVMARLERGGEISITRSFAEAVDGAAQDAAAAIITGAT